MGKGRRRLLPIVSSEQSPSGIPDFLSQVNVPLHCLRMNKNRLEAFSDGVIAILITIMVLEMKVPHGVDLRSLTPVIPVFFSYVLSYVYLGIYWNNHHHMLHAVKEVNGAVLWANLHLLFWLSILPFATGWMGQNNFAVAPTAFYGMVLLMAAIAYWVLQKALLLQGHNTVLQSAVGKDFKGKLSPLLYVLGIVASFRLPWLAHGLYVLVALMWLVPDRRIEKTLRD
jgi:uncharacterized membrane protein